VKDLLVSSRCMAVVWQSGYVDDHINKVTLRRAELLLRWVTVCGYTVSVFNQAMQANSAWSSLCG